MSRLPSSFDNSEPSDRDLPFIERIKKNCKEQPFVPIGALLTTAAVFLAGKSIRTGQRREAQKWFRYRVGFQGATIVALVVGGWYYGQHNIAERKSQDEILKEKAKMREKLWIEELERRDAEAKKRQSRLEASRKKEEESKLQKSEADN